MNHLNNVRRVQLEVGQPVHVLPVENILELVGVGVLRVAGRPSDGQMRSSVAFVVLHVNFHSRIDFIR